tara:strand:- start:53 stop:382 length:330 start_codon:yes stop_codon:yes gene_type:complete
MNFKDRIKKSQIDMEYVDLVDDEAESGYKGSGDAIVFVDAEANKIMDIVYIRDIPEGHAGTISQSAMEHGNAYLGIMSCYQFCEPQKLDNSNLGLFARIERLVAENYEW